MKKIIVIVIIYLFLIFTSCEFLFPDNNKIYNKVFLFYLDGANNLDSYALEDFDEIKKARVSLDENNVVLILFDRMYQGVPSYEDWDDTRLYEIKWKDGVCFTSELDSQELGLTSLYIDEDLDMGSASTLSGFCKFAKNRYPASNYYLDIWNHGGGWRTHLNKEICSDEESQTVISMINIREELLKIKDLHFDIIILDACVMATLEVAANFIGITDYIIFSQNNVPAYGFPYDNIIPCIFENDSEENICSKICDFYVNYYNENGISSITISFAKIDKDNGCHSFIMSFLNNLNSLSLDIIRDSRLNKSEGAETTVDFSVFSDISPQVNLELKNFIIYHYPQNLTGISIYFPQYPTYDIYLDDYNPDNVYFCKNYPVYRNFLLSYNQSGIDNIDTYEPNGVKSMAQTVPISSTIFSYIWCEKDVDYYKLDQIPLNGFKVKLTPPSGKDYDIKIYYYINDDLNILQSALPGDQIEQITIDSSIASSIDILYICITGSYGSYDQINGYQLSFEL